MNRARVSGRDTSYEWKIVALHFGIQDIMQLGMGALVLGLFVGLAPKETAPARLAQTTALARS
ncbi:hypothetical protein [Burkholderia cepacia]|uniref:hypothetical protein n=1 Tax=Burkholderia cepacia TaxID=292 RepID=UPI0021AB670F|nr:hypothetical protein [Burkholderia cepacia]